MQSHFPPAGGGFTFVSADCGAADCLGEPPTTHLYVDAEQAPVAVKGSDAFLFYSGLGGLGSPPSSLFLNKDI